MEEGGVQGVTPSEAAKYETLFRMLADDSTGSIDELKLSELMTRMGVFLSDEEVHNLFSVVDVDQSGGIDFSEFLTLMQRHKEASQLALLEGREGFGQAKRESTLSNVLRSDDIVNLMADLLILVTILFHWVVVLYEDAYWCDMIPSSDIPKFVAAGILLLDVARCMFTSSGSDTRDELPLDSFPKARADYFTSSKFWVDTAAAVPLDVFCVLAGEPDLARWFQHLRLAKMLVVSRLFRVTARDILDQNSTQFLFQFVPLVKICFWACVVTQALSVAWIAISPGKTEYIDAVYFVTYTLTTTGYGDIEVRTPEQKAFSIALFGCASCVTGLVVGKLVQFSQQADIKTDSHKKMLETLAALNHLTIPTEFKEEVLAFQLHRLKHSNTIFNEAMTGLPQIMLDRMALYARMKVVRQVPIFVEATEVCVAKVAQSLVTVMCPPEEYIVIAGEDGDEMFFLHHGMCSVWTTAGKWIATIKRGGVIGEGAMLQQVQRHVSIKTLTYCQLFRLDRTDFTNIMSQFPTVLEGIQKMAAELDDCLNAPPMSSRPAQSTASLKVRAEPEVRIVHVPPLSDCSSVSSQPEAVTGGDVQFGKGEIMIQRELSVPSLPDQQTRQGAQPVFSRRLSRFMNDLYNDDLNSVKKTASTLTAADPRQGTRTFRDDYSDPTLASRPPGVFAAFSDRPSESSHAPARPYGSACPCRGSDGDHGLREKLDKLTQLVEILVAQAEPQTTTSTLITPADNIDTSLRGKRAVSFTGNVAPETALRPRVISIPADEWTPSSRIRDALT